MENLLSDVVNVIYIIIPSVNEECKKYRYFME